MSEVWAKAPLEPSLDELLSEPIVRMMMDRDGINPHDMRYNLHRGLNRQQQFRP